MKRHLTLLSLTILVLTAWFGSISAQPTQFRIRLEDSHFSFSIYKWGVFKEEGRFRDFDGTVVFDPKSPSDTKVDIVVNTSSIDSRNDGRDRALRSDDFFSVTRYPTMRFKSVAVQSQTKDTLFVEGDITIRGITKRIIIPVRVTGIRHTGNELGTLVGFETEFTINRKDFGVGEDWAIIDKDAHIHVLIGAGSGTTARR